MTQNREIETSLDALDSAMRIQRYQLLLLMAGEEIDLTGDPQSSKRAATLLEAYEVMVEREIEPLAEYLHRTCFPHSQQSDAVT